MIHAKKKINIFFKEYVQESIKINPEFWDYSIIRSLPIRALYRVRINKIFGETLMRVKPNSNSRTNISRRFSHKTRLQMFCSTFYRNNQISFERKVKIQNKTKN